MEEDASRRELEAIIGQLRKELTRALGKNRGRSVVALVDMVVSLTLSGRILHVNSAAENHFQVFREDVIGLPVDTLSSQHFEGRTLLQIAREAQRSRTIFLKEVTSRDGTTRWTVKATNVTDGVQLLISEVVDAKRNSTLLRYVSPRQIDSVVDSGVDWAQAVKREVTVLSVRLSGFDALCDRLSAGEAKALYERYFSMIAGALIEEGAAVDRTHGADLVAVFGVPVPLENHSLVAINAALRVADLFGRLAAERSDSHLGQRIGIASGDAVAGAMGSAFRTDLVVLGTSLPLATALAGIAPAGGIALSRKTHEVIETILSHRPEAARRPLQFQPLPDLRLEETGATHKAMLAS